MDVTIPASGSAIPKRSRRGFATPLAQSTLDIRDKTRSNLFGWRGQFSPQFVEAILQAYCAPESTVFDPFMGSGTVLVEGARQGHAALGIEVNPAAHAIARLYELCGLPSPDRQAVIDRVQRLVDSVGVNALPAAAHCADDRWLIALVEALIVLCDGQPQSVRPRWQGLRETILSLPVSHRPVTAQLGDARRTGLPTASVDFILTSPPYINVFNYHYNYRTSTEALGWQPLVVARSEIGANWKFRRNRFLTVVQYCIDMAQALCEMRRVGKAKCRAVLILGRESRVLMTPFFNGEIVATLATEVAGFRAVHKQERLFTNRFGQPIREDILHLQPAAKTPRNDLDRAAREIGAAVLRQASGRVPQAQEKLLHEAIAAARHVLPSPPLEACRSAKLV